MTEPGTEEIGDDLLTIQVNGSLSPVDLDGLSRSKAQRNKCFRLLAGCTHIVDQIPDRRLTTGKVLFFHQTLIDLAGRMLLLLDSLPVILI